MAIEEIEFILLKFPEKKSPGRNCFTGEFCQTFKEGVTRIVYSLFQKIEEKGTIPNSPVYQAILSEKVISKRLRAK